jgi:transposase
MGEAYSHDLRSRVHRHVAEGHSRHDSGRRFGVSASTAIRLEVRYRKTGSLAPCKQGRPPGRGKLATYLGFLTEIVDSIPDITLRELAEALATEHGVTEHGVTVHQSSISRVLQAAGYTYKKIADGVRVWAR